MSTNGIPAEQGPQTQGPDHDVAPEPQAPAMDQEAPAAPAPEAPAEPPASFQQADSEGAADMAEKSYLADKYGIEDEGIGDDVAAQSASAARQERERLMPEYLEHYFVEDLPPINPDDPWNQGIYMRYRINQWRYVNGMDPVE